jgi:hypothetical protein
VKCATRFLVAASALCLMFAVGCGSGSKGSGAVDPASLGLKGEIPHMGASLSKMPELEMMKLKSPQDKANYLRNLDKDPEFDPKKHTEMLDKYSKDTDADVAQAAKDLLDKAK